MLNNEKHQLIMGQILKDIFTDISIAPLLGFKGGTCAYFFYDLPRFSVDLDFDLLIPTEYNQKKISERIAGILEKYGLIKDDHLKRFTIFSLLSYGDADHNIKIEINIRELISNLKEHYELKEYLGISMLVAKRGYLFGSKVATLTLRSETATRDIYDIHYFAKNNWDIDAEVVQDLTGKNLKEQLTDCIALIEKINDNQIMHGLGELILAKEKSWVKNQMKADTIFMLKNYLSLLK
ncbi:MAG: Uncharacterized protein Athens101428_441 [Candidatus Berkelbacteria bacterium Athens1014_28]|uniref:Nucleotidyl transferase AbiEii toxin, Type IV TA system n=1 Tax=Candidatus Berkelbacteria bacterium Athens1014_28 TaxID=2017145 RepID=A0A554LMI0_9BACT|nr:MAG: Uncharacterized protein Athens101428_441 [Candidatus Berkelbacteria bacterium Athens1014_28]